MLGFGARRILGRQPRHGGGGEFEGNAVAATVAIAATKITLVAKVPSPSPARITIGVRVNLPLM